MVSALPSAGLPISCPMPLQICCPHLSSRLTPVLEIPVPIICDEIFAPEQRGRTLREDATIDHDHDDAPDTGTHRACHLPEKVSVNGIDRFLRASA